MSDLDTRFKKAAEDVNNLQSRPRDDELLNIYGLYKQATVGDCNQAKPSMFQLKEKAKYESWLSKKGMSQEKAKEEYIAVTQKLIDALGLKS